MFGVPLKVKFAVQYWSSLPVFGLKHNNQHLHLKPDTSDRVISLQVCITEAENKRLKQEIDKQKKKMAKVDELERENKKVKEELQSLRKKYLHIEEVEKENIQLKEELKKYVHSYDGFKRISKLNECFV